MAFTAFFSFSLFQNGVGVLNSPSSPFFHMCKQAGFYTAKGFDTLDQTVEGATFPYPTIVGYDASTAAWGPLSASAIQTTTRTTVNTAKAYQCAILRSTFGLGAEVWMTMDFKIAVSTGVSTAYESSADYHQMFKFGDLSVRFKSSQNTGPFFNTILSIRNVTTEVATVTFQHASTTWNHLKVHAKLDATTGLIEVLVNGNTQSVAYTGQNTVGTTALASATGIFFGPPVLDNGTDLWVGTMTNVYFDDAAFPASRPFARLLTLSGETATGWAATGTSVTTIRDALTSDTSTSTTSNAKAARGTTAGSDVLFDITAPTITDLDTNLFGFQMGAGGVHSRNASVSRRLGMGVSLSGTHNMDAAVAAVTLPHATTSPPPVSSGVKVFAQVLEKPAAAGPYTKTELASIKPRLLVV